MEVSRRKRKLQGQRITDEGLGSWF